MSFCAKPLGDDSESGALAQHPEAVDDVVHRERYLGVVWQLLVSSQSQRSCQAGKTESAFDTLSNKKK
jgi:hypothetical protein